MVAVGVVGGVEGSEGVRKGKLKVEVKEIGS